jgi:peptidyl-prolyl cis-trans isomerase B (cyclophilin B)
MHRTGSILPTLFATLPVLCGAAETPSPVMPSLALTVTLDRTSYDLGDEAAAEVRLDNVSPETVRVLELQLETRSLSFRIETEGRPDLLYTVSRPNVFTRNRAGPLRIPLAPSRSLVSVVPIPLVRPGRTTITAIYAGGAADASPPKSPAVSVEVKPGGNEGLVARIETSFPGAEPSGVNRGVIVKLDADAAPLHVMNFLLLSRQGFYDRQQFVRVQPDFHVLVGNPGSSSVDDPGWNIPNEHKPDQRHVRGAVVMNHPQGRPDAAGSQFFILVKDAAWLDQPEEKYTVFGRVIEGMETIDSISRIETDGRTGRPVKPVSITRISAPASP